MALNITDVQAALKGAEYPADGDSLADTAESNGADQEIVDAVRDVPEVDGPSGVMKHLKGSLTGADE